MTRDFEDFYEAVRLAVEARRRGMEAVSEGGVVTAVGLLLQVVSDETVRQLRTDVDDELLRRDGE